MKIVVFDVGNAACALVVCPNGYSMMIDCGDHPEKVCPIDQILQNAAVLGMLEYNGHPLTLLHITHPDDDHVRNAEKIATHLNPYLVHRRRHEVFSPTEYIHEGYKQHIDKKYRGNPINFGLWGFTQNKTFSIPMNIVKSLPALSSKEKNNSSILRFVEYGGLRVLFGGDLEKDGWDWLASNDLDFINTMKNGLDVLIAPHHGHKSGFPQSLFNLTGNVMTVIHSKDGEESIEGTDVASQYSSFASGVKYTTLTDQIYFGKVLTTRSNGNIVIEADGNGTFKVYTTTSSSNHSPLTVQPTISQPFMGQGL